jgi:hypothetical protein
MDPATKKPLTRKCIVCGKRFQVKSTLRKDCREWHSTAKTCSPECLTRQKRNTKYVPWTDEEIAYIKEHANDLPFVLFYAQFCREQKIYGWPPRTRLAFKSKLHELRISTKGIYVVVNKSTLASMLGLDVRSVSKMIRDGLKISHRCPKTGTIHIAFREVRRFAAQNPERFGGLDYYKLLSVLDDDEFCREILEKYPKRYRTTKPKRVLCLTTSRCFKSISQAAKGSFISERSVKRSILQKRPVHGLTFKFYP